MFKSSVSIASAIAASAFAASALAGPFEPIGKLPDRARPGYGPALAVCDVDPAIASITLTKGARPGDVRVSYEVVNRGRSAWRSGAEQQLVLVKTVNGNTGETFDQDRALTGVAAAGASMQRASTPMIAHAFDSFEFGGTVDVTVVYDPDIRIDGNACNDDRRSGNNTASIDAATVFAFVSSRATSRTFRF